MSEETQAQATEASEATTEETSAPEFTSLEDAMAALATVRGEKADLEAVNTDLASSRDKHKSRRAAMEKEHDKTVADDLEKQGKFEELYNTERTKNQDIQIKMNTSAINSALEQALRDAGAGSNLKTALKIADMDSVNIGDDMKPVASEVSALVAAMKSDHAVLFTPNVPDAPTVKPVTENIMAGGFDAEMKAMIDSGKGTVAKINAIKKKYNR